MLEALGSSPVVEAVYRALLDAANATAAALAEVLERPEPASSCAGRASSSPVWRSARDDAFVAAPPAVALGALITERRDGLRLAEQALATLAEEHRAAVAGRSISELIEVVTGVDAIRHRYRQVQQAAATELRTFVTAPFVAVPPGRTPPSRPRPTAASHPGGAGARRARRARSARRGDRLPAQRRRSYGSSRSSR